MDGIILMGLQASGKSTFYKEYFFRSHIRLSMDMLNTRRKESLLLKACLDLQQGVVIDNTNPKKEDRQKYIKEFKAHNYKTIGYYFQSNLADCIERNEGRDGKDYIPKVGLYSTIKKLEHPSKLEGFDELYYVRIVNNKFKIEEYQDEI